MWRWRRPRRRLPLPRPRTFDLPFPVPAAACMRRSHNGGPVMLTRRVCCLLVLSALAALLVGAGYPGVDTPGSPAPGSPPDRLTSRPKPAAPAVKPLAVGDELRTEAGQRRRVPLPDGSVL